MTVPTGDSFELRLVDVATFKVVGPPLSVPVPATTRISFSPDGRYIAAVTDNDLSGAGVPAPIAFVWDVAKGGEPVVEYHFSADYRQRDLAFLPDSKQILVAGGDGTTIVDIASGAKVGHIAGAYAPIAVSPDGTTLAAALDPVNAVTIGLFDLATAQPAGDPGRPSRSGSYAWPSARTGRHWRPGPTTAW